MFPRALCRFQFLWIPDLPSDWPGSAARLQDAHCKRPRCPTQERRGRQVSCEDSKLCPVGESRPVFPKTTPSSELESHPLNTVHQCRRGSGKPCCIVTCWFLGPVFPKHD